MVAGCVVGRWQLNISRLSTKYEQSDRGTAPETTHLSLDLTNIFNKGLRFSLVVIGNGRGYAEVRCYSFSLGKSFPRTTNRRKQTFLPVVAANGRLSRRAISTSFSQPASVSLSGTVSIAQLSLKAGPRLISKHLSIFCGSCASSSPKSKKSFRTDNEQLIRNMRSSQLMKNVAKND
ncbi:hypothetical protein TNCV_1269311 [Trichonephila clavipes]|nr:hypothetical protein TNCV_1269311 [Trichonephila clavipes]